MDQCVNVGFFYLFVGVYLFAATKNKIMPPRKVKKPRTWKAGDASRWSYNIPRNITKSVNVKYQKPVTKEYP